VSLELLTPKELIDAYANGLPGVQFNQDSMDALFADGVAGSDLYAEAPELRGSGTGKHAPLWKSVLKYAPDAFREAQTTGDCVSHGSRNARDTTRAVEIDLKGESEDFLLCGATEPTYGCRGHGGAGMDPARATRFEVETGWLIRKNYEGVVDLSVYNAKIGMGWGSRGVPDAVKQLCSQNKIGRFIKIGSVQEAKDALFNGYAIHSGQNIGFSKTSDEQGITRRSGSWNHDMACLGFDDTKTFYQVCVFFIQNSWGKWNSAPKRQPPYGPLQPGMFAIDEDMMGSFVRAGSMFAYADAQGFRKKDLPSYGFNRIF
jgi:hypothetical protein